MSTSKVATGAPSTTAATPPTTTKRTRWRCSEARIRTKSVGVFATAQARDERHMVLENLEPFLRAEAEHPLDERRIDAGTAGTVVFPSG
jgi:hypothetical protein